MPMLCYVFRDIADYGEPLQALTRRADRQAFDTTIWPMREQLRGTAETLFRASEEGLKLPGWWVRPSHVDEETSARGERATQAELSGRAAHRGHLRSHLLRRAILR